jgi:hypothetical protein
MTNGELLSSSPFPFSAVPSACTRLRNAADSDSDYFYASRLLGEPAGGVNDIHFHPALPRTARLTLTFGFWARSSASGRAGYARRLSIRAPFVRRRGTKL